MIRGVINRTPERQQPCANCEKIRAAMLEMARKMREQLGLVRNDQENRGVKSVREES